MKRNQVENYADLPEDSQIGHDLMKGLMLVRASGELKIRLRQTKHARDPQDRVFSTDLHQAFRYGVPLDDELAAIADLEAIIEWLGREL